MNSNKFQVRAPGILTCRSLSTDNPNGNGYPPIADTEQINTYLNINGVIPQQEIVLSCVKVVLSTPPTSITTGTATTSAWTATTSAYTYATSVVYIDLPFLNSANLIDGIPYMSRLPILIDSKTDTTMYFPNITIGLGSDIPKQFRFRVFNENGTLFTGISEITLQFNYFISAAG